ncbi:cytochrome p450 domain-containing protein [Phthorimaea operculella]|nr:cytochrome p450 domain-containing protein [Phthorimaea operculella]
MFAFIVTLFCVFFVFVYMKLNNIYTYWDKQGVKGPKPKWFYGNFKTLFTKEDSVTSLTQKFYNEYSNEKIVGLYQGTQAILLVRDLDLAKKVLIKDFSSFTDRGVRITNEGFAKNLFSLDGDDWKILRTKLTPLFSNSKLKHMMPLLNNCAKDYMKYLHKLSEEKVPSEMRESNMKYTLKAIASVGFGIDIDTFSGEESKFIEMAEALFKPRSLYRRIVVAIDGIIPGIFKKIPITITDKHIRAFFVSLVSEIVKEREGKPKERGDFMDLMIELKEQGKVTRSKEGGVELEITDELITAQALLFYAAGFETSSSTMSFMLYELAWNLDIQERCYEEIKKVMAKYKELTYESLHELEYLSMAFDEALRKHPVAGVLLRQCVHDYEIPELKLTVQKGTKLLISVKAIQSDPQYFSDPDKYDPERFSPERKNSIQHCSYMPFGDGPRNCIGLRLAKVQSILGIAYLLSNYRVTPSERTPKKIHYDPSIVVLKSIDGIWLNLERRA